MDKEKATSLRLTQSEPACNSWFGACVLFVSGAMSFFVLGMNLTILGPIIPIFRDIYSTTYQNRIGQPIPEDTWLLLLSLTFSFLIVGAFCGGTSTKIMLTFFTRKHFLQLVHVINITGYLVLTLGGGLSGSYESVIIGRFISGIPMGVFFALVPLMMVELSAKNKQAVWQSTCSISLAFGLLFGLILSHQKVFGTASLWPIGVAFPCVPSLVYLISSLWFPETPFYLVRTGKAQEAVDVLKQLRIDLKDQIRKELREIEKEVNKNINVVNVKEMLFTKRYRNQLIAVAGVYAGFMLTGINHLTLYTDQIFLNANVAPEHVTSASIGVYGIQFLFSLLGPKLVNRFGSLMINKLSTFLAILSLVLFTVSQATSHLAPNAMPIVAIVAICIYFVVIITGIQLTTLILIGELTTEPTRSTAFALASILFWITAWTVAFVPPYLQMHLGAYEVTVWIATSTCFLLFQVFYVPDTKGKTSEEIQAHFM